MAVYEYHGVNERGRTVKGIIDADSPRAARAKLRKTGIFTSDLIEEAKREGRVFERRFKLRTLFETVGVMDVALVARQLSTLLSAGMPLVTALSATMEQTQKETLKKALTQVRERVIWGELVPYGELWRTGADEATTVTFDADVMVEGEKLPAGTYSLFTIPGEEEWTVIFNKVAEQWGGYDYDQNEDALRVTVEPTEHEHVEAMDFAIDGSDVVLRWEKVAVPFTVEKAG